MKPVGSRADVGDAGQGQAGAKGAQTLLANGMRFHQAGRLAEAEECYRRLLALIPDHAESLHLLGVIFIQRGRYDLAVDPIGRAIAANGGVASYHANHGSALQALGRLNEALAAYDAAIGLEPDMAELHANRGNALQALGRPCEALAAYDTAIRIKPDYAGAHYNRGNALKNLGRPGEALAAYDAAIGITPDYAEAHTNRGNALQELGRLDDALAAYDRALAIRPELAEAHYNRGNALQELGRPDEALAAYDTAIGIKPDHAKAHANRGNALKDLGRPEEALAAYDTALALKPSAEALSNRGNALQELGRLDEALAAHDAALAIKTDYAEAHNNRGLALQELGRLDEALAAYDQALAIKPDDADTHLNRSFALLLGGQFDAGWREYEWRWKTGRMGNAVAETTRPRWRGEDGRGRTLLIHAEQGFGDTLQFCRYVPVAAARGWRVILRVPAALCRLLAGLEGVAAIMPDDGEIVDFDAHCPMLSLPAATGLIEPWSPPHPYLRPDSGKAALWRDRLRALPAGRRIGLVWAGNPRLNAPAAHAIDRRRSIDPSLLAPLLDVPDIVWVSLQKNGPPAPFAARMVDAMAEMADFADTAALVANLDLVISVDTAMVHLAGAIGRPVWMLDRFDSCWRWLRDRDDSPWYPGLRIFRQTSPRAWEPPIATIVAALKITAPT